MTKALVIGGTSGLGLELAKLLISKYDQVVVTGRDGGLVPPCLITDIWT